MRDFEMKIKLSKKTGCKYCDLLSYLMERHAVHRHNNPKPIDNWQDLLVAIGSHVVTDNGDKQQ